MVDLIAKSPCAGLLPVETSGCRLVEIVPAAITSIAPGTGQEKPVSNALKRAHGMAFPAPGKATGKEGARCVWMGPVQAFLIGIAAEPLNGAAVTDQTDGWAVLRLQGVDAEAVLARLVPVNLRGSVFRRGHTARTQLFHMSASITRTGANSFDIMVYRSMAKTAVHDLQSAMKSLTAQK